MKQSVVCTLTISCILILSAGAQMKNDELVTFVPVSHASFLIQAPGITIAVDPVGEAASYGKPDLIVITHLHSDHFDPGVIGILKSTKTTVIAPKTIVDKLGYGKALGNGEQVVVQGISIQAVPMYNLTPDRKKFHEKGTGNGYVLTIQKKRIYISGDTEDIPEMRSLKNIDYAFVCMNLPYTMTIDQAASAVLEFRPSVVFPYHYRGTGGLSDVERFRELVGRNPSITVKLLKWY